MVKKNIHNENVGSLVDRSDDRIEETGEVFTPLERCLQMIDQFPKHILEDPNSKFIDNSAGSGNFLIVLRDRLKDYHSEEHILNNMLYAVELMEDNHKEMCDRLGVDVTHPHYVCHNALTYDYGFGEPVGVEQFF